MRIIPPALLPPFVIAALACSAPASEATGPDDTDGPPAELDWHIVEGKAPGGAILSIWGPAANDLWAVGGESHAPLVLRYDGSGWTHDTPPGAAEQLWWVHGLDGGPVMVVGDGGSAFVRSAQGWTAVPGAPAGSTLYGAWMTSATRAWAVGGPFDGAAEGVEKVGDVLLRYDGATLAPVDVPALAGRVGQRRLFKVWGSAPDDVFVVGSEGLILHYDGATWTPMESGVDAPLFTVAGRGPRDVWAVGGNAVAVLLHYDGQAWRQEALPEYPPQVLQGVWTAPGADVVVSGFFGFTARLHDGLWGAPDPLVAEPLHVVFGDSSGRLWAGGGDIVVSKAHYHGVVLSSGGEVVPGWMDTPELPDAGPLSDVEEADVTSSDDVAESPDAALPDTSSTDTGDPEPPGCHTAATTCPAALPYPGSLCQGALSCPYPVADDVLHTVHTANCEGGYWAIATTCDPAVGGGCAIPPLEETCLDPFDGAVAGADVALGSAGAPGAPFAAFGDGESVELVWGGQGSPMLAFRVSAGAAAEALTCARVHTTITIDGQPAVDATQPVVFRCGDTLRIYVVVPSNPMDCEDKVFDLGVTVEVVGVGSHTAKLKVQGGGHCWN